MPIPGVDRSRWRADFIALRMNSRFPPRGALAAEWDLFF